MGNSVEGGWLYVELAYFGDGVNRILATDEFHYEVLLVLLLFVFNSLRQNRICLSLVFCNSI